MPVAESAALQYVRAAPDRRTMQIIPDEEKACVEYSE